MSAEIIAEIGINHNGSLEEAARLVEAAYKAGATHVKFQKRTPRLCVPEDQWETPKRTPWGERLPYLEYRERMEFDSRQFSDLLNLAVQMGMEPFFSVWDVAALKFVTQMADTVCIKVPSAKLTNVALVRACSVAMPSAQLIISTGMSTVEEIDLAVDTARAGNRQLEDITLMHCHSAYPAPVSELNLRLIPWLRERYLTRVGYSGHERGLNHTVVATVLGAEIVERHITMDCSQPGTDHQASLDPHAFKRLVDYIRSNEAAMGDGVKCVWDSELPAKEKLRG